jgi:hypothetical protein
MVDTSKGWEAFRYRAGIAEQTMLWGETHEDYENLLQQLYQEFTPNGPMEENQVSRLVKAMWTRNRTDRFVQLKTHAKLVELKARNKISHLEEKLKLLAPNFLKAKNVKEVNELLDKLEDPACKQMILDAWPLKKCKSPNAWGSAIAEGLSALAPGKRFEDEEEFFRMVELFPIDEDFGTIERMDATIDRTLKRLMQLKTMKQMFRQLEPKLIANEKEIVTI